MNEYVKKQDVLDKIKVIMLENDKRKETCCSDDEVSSWCGFDDALVAVQDGIDDIPVIDDSKTVDECYVVKDEKGCYWCGLNKWDKQLRKAQMFHSLVFANKIVEKFSQYELKVAKVVVREVE